ncbi:MAG: MBL fold metallo-hydrolase [Xanthomonadales bacterium]|nr:MBL fold metallo-hydrolase [Xanthomonadales bacterium]MDH4018004.1 MBL fold metallo-hydrolase [Xanthomonadales bacterium]
MYIRLAHTLLLLLLTSVFACADSTDSKTTVSRVQYLANEGLMVVQGDTKVLFDPLFRNSYGQYQLLPKEMEEALYSGQPPFDGIDAVFISHYHGDHFSPADILRLLQEQPGIHLYAPVQAVDGLRSVSGTHDDKIFERVTAVELAYKDTPVTLEMDSLLIEAVRIPHSGWPNGRLDVENISWRITLNEKTTVLHMGDADPNDVHFARDVAYWDKRHTHIAFPPYWFFTTNQGLGILGNRIKPGHSVGVHVPVSISKDPKGRPQELRNVDLFIEPGEIRDVLPVTLRVEEN